MNSILYDRRTAYISVLLMVLVSIFILGGNSLRTERQRIVDVFRGQNELGIDTQQEAIIILQNAANLLVVADRYLDGNEQAENIRALLNNTSVPINHLTYWDHVNWEVQFATADRIMPHVRALLLTMDTTLVTDVDRGHLTEADGNIRAALRRISLSGANAQAQAFNNISRNPYTAIIATVRGVSKLPVAAYIVE